MRVGIPKTKGAPATPLWENRESLAREPEVFLLTVKTPRGTPVPHIKKEVGKWQ